MTCATTAPTLALGELNIFENPRPSSFGFKATLDVGDTADINAVGDRQQPATPAEARFKNLGQLYGTYAIGGNGSGVDFGKFYSPFGYEVVQSNGNYNYSRSLAFNLVPFYHFGARIYTAPGGLGVQGPDGDRLHHPRVVQQLLVRRRRAAARSRRFIGQLNYTDPKGKFTLHHDRRRGQGQAQRRHPPPSRSCRTTTSPTTSARTVLAGLDYVYLQQARTIRPARSTTSGYAVYYRQQFTPKLAYALRVSGFDAHGRRRPRHPALRDHGHLRDQVRLELPDPLRVPA